MTRVDRIDVIEAERLVTGRCPDPQPYGLGLLLDAARAPARADELAGEQQALTRLVAARRAVLNASPVRRRDAKVPPTARKVIVRFAAALALLVVVGVAAETGSLPAAVQQCAHDIFSMLGVPPPDTGRRHGGDPSPSLDPAPTAPTTDPTADPSGGAGPAPAGAATVDPSGPKARALCQAWNAAGRDPDGTGMNSQSWRTLVTTAGGKTRVPALCTALIGGASAGAATPPTTAPRSSGGPASPSHPVGGKGNGRPTAGPAR